MREYVLDCRIPVEPQPKERPRFSRKTMTVYTPKTTDDYENQVAQYVRYKMRTTPIPKGTTVGVDATFRTTKQTADIDNFVKALFDACNKIVWDDDKQVAELHAHIDRLPKAKVSQTGTDFKVWIIERKPNA